MGLFLQNLTIEVNLKKELAIRIGKIIDERPEADNKVSFSRLELLNNRELFQHFLVLIKG
jgi:hypothetical protein